MRPRHLAFVNTICALALLTMAAVAGSPSLHAQLPQHSRQVATVEHNAGTPKASEDAARHIEVTLAALGYTVTRRQYIHEGKQISNIEVSVINTIKDQPPNRIFIVGAHYDCTRGAPGANDHGAAAVLELARILKGIRLGRGTELKFLFFVNEEAPHMEARAPGQRYRSGLENRYPDTGNFIAFVGTQASSEQVRKALASFRATPLFPVEGLAAAAYVEGVTWFGHTSYNRHDYPAIMITDTAFLRYPYFHTANDAPDNRDDQSMARVVDGLAKVIAGLAAPVSM